MLVSTKFMDLEVKFCMALFDGELLINIVRISDWCLRAVLKLGLQPV